jgi:hypothetical protein
MDFNALYQRCDLSQSWDAPRNKKLLANPMREFVCPNDPSSNAPGAIQTNYFAVVGPNAAWAGEKPRKLADFGKDASKSIIVVEATNSGIAWPEPKDLSLDTLGAPGGNPPLSALTSDHGRREEFFFTYDYAAGVHVAMADGSVQFLRTGDRSPQELAQHRRAGRVAAFGRRAAGSRGAEQEVIGGETRGMSELKPQPGTSSPSFQAKLAFRASTNVAARQARPSATRKQGSSAMNSEASESPPWDRSQLVPKNGTGPVKPSP